VRSILRGITLVFVTTVVLPVMSAGTVLAAFLFLPLPATLPEPRKGVAGQISRIYDVNGQLIGRFQQFDTVKPVAWEDIPEVLKQAVVAVEDRRFYSHSGVDLHGTARALWRDIREQEFVEGGSTITQQYVKNAYVTRERSIMRKVREAVLASQLERDPQVTKDTILYKYLDSIYLGEGAYGVGAAAETYFRKPVNDLTLSEAALLAGIIPAPSRFNPRSNPEGAEAKRLIVLDAMMREGYISPEMRDVAATEKLFNLFFELPPEGQPATVVWPRERTETAYPYFVDYVQKYLEAKYGPDAVFQGGLEIYTTLDPVMQQAAEASVAEMLGGTEPPLDMALVAVEPPTGYVKALVGGRDFAASRVNLALGRCHDRGDGGFCISGGGTGRETGSAFKPFVLANAFEQGIAPSATFSGAPHTIAGHTFRNYGGAVYGNMDLRSATVRSSNTVFTRLIERVGVESTMDLSNRMGLHTTPFDPAVHGLSVALGPLSVSPLDMASSFGVFAARGLRYAPVPVVRVLDGEGRMLEDNIEREGERVLEEVTADNVNDVMSGVFGGTASGRDIDRPAAGKTGTTQDHRDAWFVGYTPTLSTAVWLGHSDAARPMGTVKGVRNVTGGSHPARVWQSFMRTVLADVPVTDFTEPAPIRPPAAIETIEAQQGFDVGRRRSPTPMSNGERLVEPVPDPDPSATPQTVPTTTTTTSTTTTTTPPGFFGQNPPGQSGRGTSDDDAVVAPEDSG
jgi:penicillin-binding protein 1A